MILPSKTFYNYFANSYNKYAVNKSAYLATINDFVRKEVSSPESVLDIGSGDGKRAAHIAQTLGIKKIVLLDESEEMVLLSKQISGVDSLLQDISEQGFQMKEKYDLVLVLWNVLGHIPLDKRKGALLNITSLINEGGSIFIDVNNRYNIRRYGYVSVASNLLRDLFFRNKSNGDFNLKVMIPKGEIETIVHIFSPFEIKRLIKSTGLKIEKRIIVDYDTGKICKTFFSGQLVYKLVKI